MNEPEPKPMTAPYRVLTERLELRCWQPSDAESLLALLRTNLEHLVPWMPWAREESFDLDAKVDLLRAFRGKFDLGQDFVYGVFERASGALVGGSGLHPRCGPGGLEVGYWIDRARCGRGLATELAAALTRVGLELCGAQRIELRCAPDNAASRRVPEKLGFTHEGRLRARLPWPDGGLRDTEVYTLLSAELADAPAGRVGYEAFDVLDRPVRR